MNPSWEHQQALESRRQYEAHLEAVAAVHALAEERRRAAPRWDCVQDRVHRDPGYLHRF